MSRTLLYLFLFLALSLCSCDLSTPEKLRGNWETFTETGGAPTVSDFITGIAVDREGNVRVATMKGVRVLSAQGHWTRYGPESGLGTDWATDIIVDKKDRIWVSTRDAGVRRLDGTDWSAFTPLNSELPGNFAHCLAVDEQDNVWVLLDQGLSAIHADDTASYVGTPLQGVHGSLAIDVKGHVWIATLDPAALAEYDPTNQRWNVLGEIRDHVELSPKGSRPLLWAIAADRQEDHIWLAADSIIEIEHEQWRVLLPEYEPSAVFVDTDGYKWFGVGDGLLLLSPDGQQWWHYEGLVALESVSEITRDSSGHYWFATMLGVVRFTPAR